MAKAKGIVTIEAKAQLLKDLRLKIAELEKQEDDVVVELRAHVTETHQTNIGCMLAYERLGVAKMVGLENKSLKVAQEQMINEPGLATYVKTSLDVGKMYAALQTDKSLVGHLSEKGLKIEQDKAWYFKLAK